MWKIAIVGGGPAGLAVANALFRASIDFRIFEMGPPLEKRRHNVAEQLASGVGGAGLFSDGKFSFYPSGTHLYTLNDAARLHVAYNEIAALLNTIGITAPRTLRTTESEPDDSSVLGQKTYSSHYGSLTQRKRLVEELTNRYNSRIRSFSYVERILKTSGCYRVRYRDGTGRWRSESFTHIVIATGRFGGHALRKLMEEPIPLDEQRYELGIRIEHPDDVGFLKSSPNPDVKFIMNHLKSEIRTFCTCRNGEVWLIPYQDVSALSGRSDGPPSNFSNFGLLARFAGPEHVKKGRVIWEHFLSSFRGSSTALWQPLPEFTGRAADKSGMISLAERPWHPRRCFVRGDVAGALHPELRAILVGGLNLITEKFPDMNSPDTICLFPAVEGAGIFPASDAGLRLETERMWFCGDVVGRFRGLVPALVSGQYVGLTIANDTM